MSVAKKIKELFLKSGITINSPRTSMFFLKRKRLMTTMRFKIDPKILLNNKFDSKDFSLIISEISIGPAFKTTAYERHNTSDDIIYKYITELPRGGSFADIGVSDGTSALYLIKKMRNTSVSVSVSIFDKYTHLNLHKKWYGHIYSNQDKEIVYIKFLFLLLYVYPLDLQINAPATESITFDNPALESLGLHVDYFDVFETKLGTSVNFIKCANILNPVYFAPEEIKKALRNLHHNLIEDGYLFIIHNTRNNESLLILRKIKNKLLIEENINNDDLSTYIKITDYFKVD